MTRVGDPLPSGFCPEEFHPTTDFLVCDMGGLVPGTPRALSFAFYTDEFVFNRSNGRFQSAFYRDVHRNRPVFSVLSYGVAGVSNGKGGEPQIVVAQDLR